MSLGWTVLSGFILAAIAPFIHKFTKNATGWLLSLLPLGIAFYLFTTYFAPVTSGETFVATIPWFADLGANLTFYLDGLSLMFALLISVFGFFIIIYAGGYLKGDPHLGRFYLYLIMFMASMLGVVLASNLIGLFIFWELTSISSFFLIGYKYKYLSARKAAQQALLITGLGGLALLAGFILIGLGTGTFELTEILQNPEALKTLPAFPAILIFLILGAFTKSAQWPFHVWLPNAMEAPTPVSAYLHSATMVKAGIYLLARFSPLMEGVAAWQITLTSIGAITALMAAILALKASDLKQILAYSTLIALGTLTLLIGSGTEAAFKAAMVFLLAHSLYKGALFMAAGAIDHEAGTRDIRELGGLIGKMPITFFAVLLAGISMAGLPPAFGFIGKELSYKALLYGENIFVLAALLTNMGLFAASIVVIAKPFFGKFKAAKDKVHEAPLSLFFGPVVLATSSIVFGFFPGFLDKLMTAAQKSLLGVQHAGKDVHLHLFPETFSDPAFILSMITFAVGAVIFLLWRPVFNGLNAIAPRLDIGPARWYLWALEDLERFAKWQTRRIQTGNLRNDIRYSFIFTFALVAYALYRSKLSFTVDFSGLMIYDFIVFFLMLGGAFAAVRANTRLSAITALGAVGFSVALVFIVYAAPDLAITQFMIETLVVIIIALVIVRLPSFHLHERANVGGRWRDAIIAGVAGLCITLTMLVVLQQPLNTNLSEYFAAESVPHGKGHNIVNVILVDFRGVDTMGEISVLAIAAMGVYALLKFGRKEPEDELDLADQSGAELGEK